MSNLKNTGQYFHVKHTLRCGCVPHRTSSNLNSWTLTQYPRNQFKAQVHLSWGGLWAASSCQLCSSTDLLPLRGPRLPHANKRLNSDKATLLNISQPVSLAKCVNHSLPVPSSVSDSSLLPLWTRPHGSISLFYLSPISPHPIRHWASIAPREEEDGPSCGAQVCLSEVSVCMCECMKAGEGASERTITEQVSFHLCRSQLTFLSARVALFLSHASWARKAHIYTKLLVTGLHNITDLGRANAKLSGGREKQG